MLYTHEADLDYILFLYSDSLNKELNKRKNRERVVGLHKRQRAFMLMGGQYFSAQKSYDYILERGYIFVQS